jgi:UPF0755 protein
MDFENPQNGKQTDGKEMQNERRPAPRHAARRPAQSGQPDEASRARRSPLRIPPVGGTKTEQDAGSAQQKQQPARRGQQDSRDISDMGRSDRRTHAGNDVNNASRLPVLNPREQLEMLDLDNASNRRADIVRRRSANPDSNRAVQAPLPRDIQFETPEIDPELLRRSSVERQIEAGRRRENPSKPEEAAKGTSVQSSAVKSVARPSKPLPKRSSDSSYNGRVRIGYKRADEFLPEKLTVTPDRRVITDADRHSFIEGRDPAEEEFDAADENEPARRGSALSSLLKAIIYIVFVLTLSGFLSYFIISIGNDLFAFVKSDEEITVSVPEYATIDNIADILTQKGIIKYPYIFKIYAMVRKDDGAFVAGEYVVKPSMSYDQLRTALKGPVEERKQISITIPEGYTVDEIIDLFVNEYGIGTREGFINAIENADFDYWFLEELEPQKGRKYRLEGYLYPDTYYFFTDWSEESILRKFLNNFHSKFNKVFKERCEELGMTVDELITLASMIEAEGKFTYEFGAISAVFHNRMNNPSVTGGKLESDATIQYILPERHEELTAEDLAINSPYNTYMYAGLPPGPITNPTINAIYSAMYPDEVNYYYFVARPNGQNLFATTYQEHLANKQQAANERAAMKNQ